MYLPLSDKTYKSSRHLAWMNTFKCGSARRQLGSPGRRLSCHSLNCWSDSWSQMSRFMFSRLKCLSRTPLIAGCSVTHAKVTSYLPIQIRTVNWSLTGCRVWVRNNDKLKQDLITFSNGRLGSLTFSFLLEINAVHRPIKLKADGFATS